jgi:integrating conjugative element protein (TIGR03761 family)
MISRRKATTVPDESVIESASPPPAVVADEASTTDTATPPLDPVRPPPDEAPSAAESPPPAIAKEPASRPDVAMLEVGQLADDQPDTMTLHTRDAYRMFLGRVGDGTEQRRFITGGRRFAAVLKAIWHLSANDNPYADWILIRTYDALMALRDQLSRTSQERERAIEQLSRRGLVLSVMISRRPKTVELGFRSPYGYATADLLVEFDYYVRMVKTLIHKDRMSDAEGKAAITGLSRKMRSLFVMPVRWEHYLLREEMRPLTRADYLPGADAEAKKRVAAALGLFGELPRNVFIGMEAPRHTRRRVRLSDAELRLLQEAPLTWAPEDEQGETDLL